MRTSEPTAIATGHSFRQTLPTLRVGLGVVGLIYVSSLPATLEEQLFGSALTVLLVGAMSVVWRDRDDRRGHDVIRIAMIFLSLAATLRYLIWRGTDTLPLHFGVAAAIIGLLLFVTECYSYAVNALGHLPNLLKSQRTPLPLPADPAALPVVDVYIPTYNEDPELVHATIVAATQIRYPSGKLRVYVLDDGGTSQMLADTDPVRAAAARRRADKIRDITSQFGATYLTREKNEHAKAGNLNAALKITQGEFIVVLDCDHVPASEFVEKTLGFFLADPSLFLVQTPHYFVNPDPLERNLATFNYSPSENDMFYNKIQPGLDAWGATFFCGSAAMLRRVAIEDIGGFSTQTVTEDAETTLRAFAQGYTSAYLNQPLISGLQPETFSGFIQQRARWGQGMWQIFLFLNPWRLPKLSLMQRILFTNFALFWGFPITRLIHLIMPIITLLLYVPLANAEVIEVVAYGAPALLCSTITTQFIYGKVRWPFISYLYEVIQSIHLTVNILHLLRSPRAPQFRVTPKGEILEKDFVSALAKPFYLLAALNAAALGMCVYRLHAEPELTSMLVFVGLWASIDFVFLLCALGVMLERKQRRFYPRASVRYPARLCTDNGLDLQGTVVDASATGAGLLLDLSDEQQKQVKRASRFAIRVEGVAHTLEGRLQKMKLTAPGKVAIGLAYTPAGPEQMRAAVAIPYGSGEQLMNSLQRRHRRRSVASAFLMLLKKAIVRGGWHLAMVTAKALRPGPGKLNTTLTAAEKK